MATRMVRTVSCPLIILGEGIFLTGSTDVSVSGEAWLMRGPVDAVSCVPVADILAPGIEGGAAPFAGMLVAPDRVSRIAFEHGPAEVPPGFVAPEELGAARQIPVPTQ